MRSGSGGGGKSVGLMALLLGLWIPADGAGHVVAQEDWPDAFYSRRLRFTFAEPAAGRIEVAFPAEEMIGLLAPLAPQPLDLDTFAFEKAVLVDPARNEVVGRFRLLLEDRELIENPGFELDAKGRVSGWPGMRPADFWRQEFGEGPERREALALRQDALSNTRLRQPLALEPGAFYLLRYRLWKEPLHDSHYGMGVQLVNPAKRLFLSHFQSYAPELGPSGAWFERLVLCRPPVREVECRVSTAFVGTGAVDRVSLRPARWALLADLPRPTRRLDLYTVGRAGHRLTQPTEDLIRGDAVAYEPLEPVQAQASMRAVSGKDAFLHETDGLRVWSLPPETPLREAFLPLTAPLEGGDPGPLRLDLARGFSTTALLVIETGTPRLHSLEAASDLPLDWRVEAIAPIPVFDGPHPSGQQTGVRYDALMPLNHSLMPPSEAGLHPLAVTFTAGDDTPPGRHEGTLRLRLATPGPAEVSLEVPVVIRVLPPVIRPMRHFGTVFGGTHVNIAYRGGNFTRDGTSVAAFHGLDPDLLWVDPDTGENLRLATDQRAAWVARLTRAYHHRLLDYHLVPQGVTMYQGYTYRVVPPPAGEGLAPTIEDWDFSVFDKALDEMVLGRDIQAFVVYHTNGDLMDRIRLLNQVTYSWKPADGRPRWEQVSRPEFRRLVGDFFEGLAAHLEKKGCLDRALFVIDECGVETYDQILDFVRAVRSRPHAARIRIAHTAYKSSAWRRRLEDGALLMDEVLDVPMACNNEHQNFFEPQFNARFRKPKDHWVYYVQTDHLPLTTAGLSTLVTPLKLDHFGARGWYCWASFIWSLPYPERGPEYDGWLYRSGPVINPWVNPFYHHGPGVLSFFYPPDPRGPAQEPTLDLVPSYRLSLMRDGIQALALLNVLERGVDDAGRPVAAEARLLKQARAHLDRLWAPSTVQWYLGYGSYRRAMEALAAAAATPAGQATGAP